MESVKRTRVWRSDSEKISLVNEWKESGLSQRAFCLKHNIILSGFNRWAKIYDKDHKSSGERTKHTGFTKIKVAASSVPTTPMIEVVFINGTRLNFFHQVESDYLRSLLG